MIGRQRVGRHARGQSVERCDAGFPDQLVLVARSPLAPTAPTISLLDIKGMPPGNTTTDESSLSARPNSDWPGWVGHVDEWSLAEVSWLSGEVPLAFQV